MDVHLSHELIAALAALLTAGVAAQTGMVWALLKTARGYGSLNETIVAINAERTEFIEERRVSEKERHTLQETVTTNEILIAKQEAEIVDLKCQIDSLTGDFRRAQAAHEKDDQVVKTELVALRGNLAIEKREREILQRRVNMLEVENQTLKGERALLVTQMAELTRERDTLRVEVAALRAEIEEIKKRGTGPLREVQDDGVDTRTVEPDRDRGRDAADRAGDVGGNLVAGQAGPADRGAAEGSGEGDPGAAGPADGRAPEAD